MQVGGGTKGGLIREKKHRWKRTSCEGQLSPYSRLLDHPPLGICLCWTTPTVSGPAPPSRAWEVARIVVAPPSSVVKCVWEVFAWGFGVLFLSCVCVSVSGVLFSIGVYVCVTC